MADFVHLSRDGVSVLIELTDDGLPVVLHWGAGLGELDPTDAEAIRLGSLTPEANNEPAVPTRISILPEHTRGWHGRPGVSGSRAGRDWSPRWHLRTALVDDRVCRHGVCGGGRAEFRAVDPAAELAVTITMELLPGGALRTRAELTNTGREDYQLDDLVLSLPVPERATELLDLAGRWGRERSPQRHDFGVGTWLREGRHGRTGADAATVLHAGTGGFGFASGEVWAVHTAWSGNHTHYAERLWTGAQVLGGGELLWPGEVILGEQESYTSPWLYSSHGIGLDQVAGRFHRHLRSREGHVGPRRPVLLNVWEAVYFDHSLDKLTELAERAAALGVERFVLDDGWFGSRRDDTSGLGDWTVSAKAWPEGLHPLINRVRELGMEFGLWFEPEMINIDSDVARAHPEWIMRPTPDRLPMESRNQQVINLGLDECYDHVHSAIQAILDEYDIAYLKWDHNRDLIDAAQPGGTPGTHDQTLSTYRMLDQLKADNPGLEIESCASGGGRVDLGIVERTDRVWASDCIDPHERQLINRWTGQLLPPELVGSHIASGRSHTTGRLHDLNYRAATAVFGHLGIEWDLTCATEAELEELQAWIEFYKQHRELLLGGDAFRLDLTDASLHAHGVLAPDRRRAIVSWSAIERSEVVYPGLLRIPGLLPAQRYRIRPVIVGNPPSGLFAPPWFNAEDGAEPSKTEYRGVQLTGLGLATVGLRAPRLDPDQTVLFLITAES